MTLMATQIVAPRLALVGILFLSLSVFHDCSQDIAENGSPDEVRENEMKHRRLKVFISPKKCFKKLICAYGKCWCCGLKLAAESCWATYQACLRHCTPSSSFAPRAPPK